MTLTARFPSLAAFAEAQTARLRGQGVARRLVTLSHGAAATVTWEGKEYVNFSGNDYLGLSRHPEVIAAAKAALEREGTGAGAARLVTGNHPAYEALERALAAWKGAEAACVFGSGYLANLGVIPALAEKGDLILADRLSHACMLDGARLSGAKLLRFRHNDVAHCAALLAEAREGARHCLILTESIFSMDGDAAPLAELAALAKAHDAWLAVDDAHGLKSEAGLHADLVIGTLSKALGSYGGYACGPEAAIRHLVSSARSFLFSTALPPSAVAAAAKALEIAQREPRLREIPLAHARRFAQALGLAQAPSPIVPLMLGTPERALAAMEALKEKGFWVAAIRPPTVPAGTSRLRVTFSAAHEDAQVTALIEAVRAVL